MRKQITKVEEMQLLGLLTLARQYYKTVDAADHAMRKILEDEDDYGNQLSDAIFDDSDFNQVLKNMEVEVI